MTVYLKLCFMTRKILIVILVMVSSIIAVLLFSYDYYGAERMAFDGQVVSIELESRNHGLPLVTLRTKVGLKLIQHYRLYIDPQLKIGDHFSKESGSRDCTINNEVRYCVR
jgi:hypothetical protein